MTRLGTLAMLAAALLACGAGAPSQAALDKPTTLVLKPDVAVPVAGTALVLRLIGIVSDSRCPRGVTCFWAGEVRVRLSVRNGNEAPVEHEIVGGESIPTGAYLIGVVKVDPEPVENQKISPRDYRVTVQVEPAAQ